MTDCLFCKILAGEIPCRKVYENDTVLAFHDIAPQAPVHILVIPKKHTANVTEADASLAGALVCAAAAIAAQEGIADGFRLVSNCGAAAGQTVEHLHFHILGGQTLGTSMA